MSQARVTEILEKCYDGATGLNVNAEVEVTVPAISVDNVGVKDHVNDYYLKVEENGSINVNATVSGVATEEKQDDQITLMGEVQENPTSNTILGRLKDLLTGIVLAAGSNKIGSINIRNNANDANIDPLSESTFTGRIGEVQATPTSNTILGRLKDLSTGIVLAAGTNQIGKIGYTLKKVSANFTRPADTTQYAIGDAISNSTSAPVVFQLDLSSVGAVNGQSVEIRKIAVISSAKQSTLPLVNIYLSSATFTATNDNSALDIDDTTMEAGGAWFTCDEQNYTASNSRVAKSNSNCPMVLAAADNKLYGILQAANAYTPVSGEKFTIVAWVALL